ncbi:hypothetical protein GSN43_004736 [Salmonella enterica]|nr:hypothetical protein [Salmonella enterica]
MITGAVRQRAYDFFNEKLFSNELPPCLITLQREKRTYGYCSFKRFVGRESGYTVDEIAMNPVCHINLWGKPGIVVYCGGEHCNKAALVV